MADMQELIARLEAAEAGGRELDWLIAKALFGFSMWKSKHGHWNINWPDDWPFSSRPLHCSVPGRLPEDIFDSETGKRLPPEIEPTEWLDEVECPIWTTSLDAALALAERLLPGWYVGVQQNRYLLSTGPEWTAYLLGPEPKSPEIEGDGHTAALAMCIAVLCVIHHGYEAAGEVSPNLKAKAQGEGG